jgi:hypothetical protein
LSCWALERSRENDMFASKRGDHHVLRTWCWNELYTSKTGLKMLHTVRKLIRSEKTSDESRVTQFPCIGAGPSPHSVQIFYQLC